MSLYPSITGLNWITADCLHIGLLTVINASYLISITRREQVAQLHNHPVYVISDVALTPLSSYKDAESSVASTRTSLAKSSPTEPADGDENSDDEAVYSGLGSDDVDDEEIAIIAPPQDLKLHKRSTSVVEDVFAKKGGYGRFARNWFSRNGWAAERKMAGVGLSAAGVDAETDVAVPAAIAAPVPIVPGVEENAKAGVDDGGIDEEDKDGHVAALLPKLLRTTSLLFGSSRSFFFAYDYDISRSVSNRRPENGSDLPLHQEVDPLFFWNRNVIQPFIDAGQYSLVLPLIQGFVGQRSFVVDKHPVATLPKEEGVTVLELKDLAPKEETAKAEDPNPPSTPKYDEHGNESSDDCLPDPLALSPASTKSHTATVDSTSTYLLTLISRRSIKRAGLRYLRRGVDDDGHCANSVETEQILSDPSWSSSPIYSFIQVRGSIPVFFSQSPYSFKPVPQMQHSQSKNFAAFKKHFANLADRYGGVAVTSLVEKHDNEAIVGEAYERYVKQLNEEGGLNGNKVTFEWFDFHSMCRGMKFENISLLLDTLSEALDSFTYTIARDSKVESRQSGVLRTNCMDCLDRTNVVQSAVARRALELQLKAEGFDLSAQLDQTTQWFNVLWADNGDAVSKQYASTAAMKGDFTRTRKRDYRGALTDMGLSISRFYSGYVLILFFNHCYALTTFCLKYCRRKLTSLSIVNDYFSQTTTDFLLGTVSALIFEDFGTNLMSADPSVSLSRMRQRGIEISHKLAIADPSEDLLGGWAFLTPSSPNVIKAPNAQFEEGVLLLTDVALYICRFDWNMEKVSSFERVDLRHVTSVKWGPYITSTLTNAQCDEKRNVGLVVAYRAGADDVTRVNTRSLSTVPSHEGDALGGAAVSPDRVPAKTADEVRSRKEGKTAVSERIIALKALPARSAAVVEGEGMGLSEETLVRSVAEEIGRVVGECRGGEAGEGGQGIVQRGDVIGIVEAKRATGWVDLLEWRLKRLVWA